MFSTIVAAGFVHILARPPPLLKKIHWVGPFSRQLGGPAHFIQSYLDSGGAFERWFNGIIQCMTTWYDVKAAKDKMDAAEATLCAFLEGPRQDRSEDRIQHRQLSDELQLLISDYLETFTIFNQEQASS